MKITPDLLNNANCRAWLRLIRAGESSQHDDAYRTMFGGSKFDSFDDHPRIVNKAAGLTSTAAGAYQFLSRTWDECKSALKLQDFGPTSQDLAALFLTDRRGALQDVIDGKIVSAIHKCNKEWASLPGSPYGQPVMTLSRALEVYAQYGGELAQPLEVYAQYGGELAQPLEVYAQYGGELAQPAQPEGKAMAPFIIPAVVELAKLIPRLGGMFGGSEVAQRNVAAAGVVVDAVVGAVGAANAQDAVEQIQKDPAARDAAAKAVEGVWHQISEAGSGGIDGARKADRATSAAGDMLHSPSFWVTLALLPLVYLVVGSVVGLWGEKWPSDVRAAIATAIVSLIVGGAAGYFWGQTTSRNRTPAP